MLHMKNKSCTFYNDMRNVMTFFQDQPVLEKKVEFPPGTRLVRTNPGHLACSSGTGAGWLLLIIIGSSFGRYNH